MRRAWNSVTLGVVLTIGCANTGPVSGQDVDCQPGDQACHNAAWQQTPAAHRHQEAMKEVRRKEKEAWERQVLAEAKQESRMRAKKRAQLEAAQWWCFEGKDDHSVFGQCRPSAVECSKTRGRRVAAGLRGASECEPYAHAICFNATSSLKKSLGVYCFNQPELCTQYREHAVARDYYGVSACGLI